MCGEVHYGEVEELVSVERWSCSRGVSCVVEYIHYWEVDRLVCVGRWSLSRGALCVVKYTMGRLRDWSL